MSFRKGDQIAIMVNVEHVRGNLITCKTTTGSVFTIEGGDIHSSYLPTLKAGDVVRWVSGGTLYQNATIHAVSGGWAWVKGDRFGEDLTTLAVLLLERVEAA